VIKKSKFVKFISAKNFNRHCINFLGSTWFYSMRSIRCEVFSAKHSVRSTWYFRKLSLLVIV